MENYRNFKGCTLMVNEKHNKNRYVILFPWLLLLSIIELFLKEMSYLLLGLCYIEVVYQVLLMEFKNTYHGENKSWCFFQSYSWSIMFVN